MKTYNRPPIKLALTGFLPSRVFASQFVFGIYAYLISILKQKCVCPLVETIRKYFTGQAVKEGEDLVCTCIIKCAFDKLFAVIALIALFPLFLLIAIIIKMDTKGSIFYVPHRAGKDGVPFRCMKFRTMYSDVCDDPVGGRLSTSNNDPRITPVGRFLRKYSLDELPQLFNILRGDMSVVGPRPHRMALSERFAEVGDLYQYRNIVKPGLTGWAQINGWRGPTETITQRIERINHDIWYIKNYSFKLDLSIIIRTLTRGGFIDPSIG